jgi:YD repeat-containing protein
MKISLACTLLVIATCVATAANAAETRTYTYDAKGRLIQAKSQGVSNKARTTTYQYDRANNKLRETTTKP